MSSASRKVIQQKKERHPCGCLSNFRFRPDDYGNRMTLPGLFGFALAGAVVVVSPVTFRESRNLADERPSTWPSAKRTLPPDLVCIFSVQEAVFPGAIAVLVPNA